MKKHATSRGEKASSGAGCLGEGAEGGARCSPSSTGASPGSSAPSGPAEASSSATVAARSGVYVAVALAMPLEVASDLMTQMPPALLWLCFCSHAAGSGF